MITISDSDGNSMTIEHHRTDDFPILQKAEAYTAGGKIRSQTTGKRFVFKETALRMEGPELQAFMDFITSGALSYYVDYSVRPETVPSGSWPMEVAIRVPGKDRFAWNHKTAYYLNFEMESVDTY